VALLAWETLQWQGQGVTRLLAEVGLGAGLFAALVGASWLAGQRLRAAAARGVSLEHDGGRGRLLLIGALLAGAFLLALWPWSGAWAWLGNVLPVALAVTALGLGWQGMRAGAPRAYLRAQAAYQHGELDKALAMLRQVEEQHPTYHGLYHLRALIYRQRRAYDDAAEAAHRLIALRPAFYYGHVELGLTLLAAQRPAEARVPLERAAALAPNLAEARFNLGLACAEAEDHQGAVAALRASLRLGLCDEVTRLMAHYYLSLALRALGHQAEAQGEIAALRAQRGALKRWQRELDVQHLAGGDQAEERKLLGAIQELTQH
jgi:tetratricopeptide (TPR) repeat protein